MKKRNINYLFIDYGNTNIKAGIYKTNKFCDINFIHNESKPESLLNKFNKNDLSKVDKIVIAATVKKVKLEKFINTITKYINKPVKVICANDFNGLIDLSNINKKVVIGIDLLLLGLYASRILKEGAILCLGTVYTGMVVKHNQFKTMFFIPSVAKAINNISKITSISDNLIPKVYDKHIGLNTPDCIATGANILLSGYADSVVSTYKVDKNKLLVTGGDSDLYLDLKKKYKVIDNLTLRAMPIFVKEKKW